MSLKFKLYNTLYLRDNAIFVLFILLFVYSFLYGTEVLLSFMYSAILFSIVNIIITNNKVVRGVNLKVFLFYIFLSIILYELQKYLIPEWIGFSGPYGGVGTDDSRFYAAITKLQNNLPILAQKWGVLIKPHSFTKFLNILFPFEVIHPLQLIIPNIIGISFIPYFTYRLSFLITNDKKVSKIAWYLVLFGPLILTNGLILIRDGWTTTLFVAGLYYLLRNNTKAFIITLIILFFVRIASGIMLLATLFIFVIYRIVKRPFVTRNQFALFTAFLIALLFIFILSFSFLQTYIESKGVSLSGRTDFLEDKYEQYKGTILYTIYTLPYVLRLIVGFVFFFLQPFFRVDYITDGIFNIRRFIVVGIMPVLFIFYYRYFFSGLMYAIQKHKKNIVKLFVLLFVLLLILSQFSVQGRHKTMLMPLFYILIAYGIVNNTKNTKIVGGIVSALIFIVQIIFMLR